MKYTIPMKDNEWNWRANNGEVPYMVKWEDTIELWNNFKQFNWEDNSVQVCKMLAEFWDLYKEDFSLDIKYKVNELSGFEGLGSLDPCYSGVLNIYEQEVYFYFWNEEENDTAEAYFSWWLEDEEDPTSIVFYTQDWDGNGEDITQADKPEEYAIIKELYDNVQEFIAGLNK